MRNRYGFEPRPRTVAELLRWPALFCFGLGVGLAVNVIVRRK